MVEKNPSRVDGLRLDPKNRRQRTARGRDMIVQSLKDVGAGRSIVIDERNVILAGNGVVDAAAEAGITKLRIIDSAGDEIIALRRTGLSARAKRDLAMYDNRTGELAEWNLEQLKIDREKGEDFEKFFTGKEIGELLSIAPKSGRTDPDDVPRPRKTKIRPGDIFALGNHRLMCGDSTDRGIVVDLLDGETPELMVTDPPYGVSYDPTWRAAAGINRNKKKMGTVTNDHRADWTEAWKLFPGQVAYVWHAGLHSATVQANLEASDFSMRAQIIWAKDRLVLGRGDYHWQHEPCWYAVRLGKRGDRNSDRTQSTLWRIAESMASTVWEIPARDDEGHGHGTQKPVECMERPIRNHLAKDIYDPFVGSGSSIIAAERLSRRCFAVEIEPTWCQVSIDRWEAFTGLTATKIRASKRPGRRRA